MISCNGDATGARTLIAAVKGRFPDQLEDGARYQFFLVDGGGVGKTSKTFKWTRRDSNTLPPACKAGALPAELLAHNCE